MQITTEIIGETLVARVGDARIDAAVAIRFKDMMRDIAAGHAGCARIVLDLARVGFVDSSGLGAIVSVMKHLGGERRLELAALTENVARVLRLTRMDSVFVIHDTAPAGGIGNAA